TRGGRNGLNLTGGLKQRISIAGALIRKARILVFDDSLSSLDLETGATLLEAMQNNHCTHFIITLNVSKSMNAFRILRLDEGKMLALGTHEELLKQSELYKRIVESQFGEGYQDAK